MLENGKRVFRKVKAKRFGRTNKDMLVSIKEDSKMVRVVTSSQMTVFMKVSGLLMICKDM